MIPESPITEFSRAGAAAARKLKKLGIETAADLLFYFPFRYEDFTRSARIAELRAGEAANVVGAIEFIRNKKSFRRRMTVTEALISDRSGTLRAVWFNQPFIARNLKEGDEVSLAGRTEEDYGGLLMKSPSYEKAGRAVHTRGLVPIYHLTAGLTEKQIRFFISQAMPLAKKIKDWLPAEILKERKLLALSEALGKIHFPKTKEDFEAARRRLSFDELFLVQLRSRLTRREVDELKAVPAPFAEKQIREFVAGLPFKLTNAQKRATWEIIRDLERERPMTRLLSGDVGSGKTVVALIAALNAISSGGQAAIMAPTEILARQHFENISKLAGKFKIKVGLVTGSEARGNWEDRNCDNPPAPPLSGGRDSIHPSSFREGVCEKTASGNPLDGGSGEIDKIDNPKKKIDSKYIIHNASIIIGTHALIQEKVGFKNLVFAVIDEQHRFGVEQRKKLIEKSGDPKTAPHFLSMTATPIPRSLALALFGDLDVSVIDELPAGRKKIVTSVVSEEKRSAAYDFIRKQVGEGRQVFVICPLIDFSDRLGVKSVKDEYEKLKNGIFPELEIGILHGRMKSAEKEAAMNNFLENKTKILVSTSVVEVGVDAPNATVMLIEGADRFGLAQLHQFRGRVGRGADQSYCFLFTDSRNEKTLKRLGHLSGVHNGFELAKIDLKFRGPGEVYGTAQKGFPELKIATLFDYELLRSARQAAETIADDLSRDKWPLIRAKLGEWEKTAHLE